MSTDFLAGGETHRFDLVILGSGSTAFAAALTAQAMGKTAVMTESRALGGTCVNRGCLPSKNLIEAAKLVFEARNPRYPGLTANGGLHVDFGALIAQKDEVIRLYRDKKYDGLLGVVDMHDAAIHCSDGTNRHAIVVAGAGRTPTTGGRQGRRAACSGRRAAA